jgi:segregation and condensation protein B
MTTNQPIKHILEALLFASNQPLSLSKVQSILKEEYPLNKKELREVFKELAADYKAQNRAFELKEIAEGYQLQTCSEFKGYVKQLFPIEQKRNKLSPSTLEVLAIIAYKQPITKAEVEAIRGVDSNYSLSLLLEKQLCTNKKKLEAPGNPSLYETTPSFLEYFGLKNIRDLPKVSETDIQKLIMENQL